MDQDPIPLGDSTFVSYAQNSEDVLLWRALGHISDGHYIDVGACDPVEYSVTKAFYDRGWSGINVEPVDEYVKRLVEMRPRDVTVQAAASDFDGTAKFHVAQHTGLSSLLEERVAEMSDRGFVVEETEVEVRRLDAIVSESPLHDAEIHFLKIDVEGAEGRVLAGFDLQRIRPWVIMIESTELLSAAEGDGEWKQTILDNGYAHALFDGLNSVYVANEHSELLHVLSYPVGVHDQPYIATQMPALREFIEQHRHAADAKAAAEVARLMEHIESQNGSIDQLIDNYRVVEGTLRATEAALEQAEIQLRAWRDEISTLEGETGNLQFERSQMLRANHENFIEQLRLHDAIDAYEKTVSWRVTRPLRAVRRIQSRRGATDTASKVLSAPKPEEANFDDAPSAGSSLYEAMLTRLHQVADLIDGDRFARASSDDVLVRLASSLSNSELESTTAAWLVLVASGNAYPNDSELSRAARALRQDGPDGLFHHARRYYADCARLGRISELPLEIVTNAVLVDVSHTAAHSLHTGIQRVVRETANRWLTTHSEVLLCHWDFFRNSPRLLAATEVTRFSNWRDHVNDSSDDAPREIEDATDKVVVPWKSTLIIPELAAEPDRCDAYRTMKLAGICSLSMIVYDMIPFTASETVADGMTGMFSNAVSVAKAADRLSAISHATANEYAAFVLMLSQQGLPGPVVVAHTLPASAVELSADDLATTRAELRLGSAPLVLVVGSHEPRKTTWRFSKLRRICGAMALAFNSFSSAAAAGRARTSMPLSTAFGPTSATCKSSRRPARLGSGPCIGWRVSASSPRSSRGTAYRYPNRWCPERPSSPRPTDRCWR